MSRALLLRAPAKINWSLAIIGHRADGYHLLRSLMQSVSLFDEVELRESKQDVCCCDMMLPGGGENIALAAWRTLKSATGCSAGLSINIRKHIPAGGGLAGGSADAAAVLLGANSLFSLGLSLDELCRISLCIGADLPFCLHSGLALVEGIGDRITPLDARHKYWLTLVNPGFSVSTPAVYAAFDQQLSASTSDIDAVQKALLDGDMDTISSCCINMLESPAFALYPELVMLRQRCASLCPAVLMSGSGGTMWMLAHSELQARQFASTLSSEYPIAFPVQTLCGAPTIIQQ